MTVLLCASIASANTNTPSPDNYNISNNITTPNDDSHRLRLGSTSIKGHIIDKSTNEHIPYVTIIVKGTTIGTVADATGHFMLRNLPDTDFTLVAEFLGYKSVEVAIPAKHDSSIDLSITLEEQSMSMDDVVVSATRNETNKRHTATIVNVTSNKIFENTASSNLAESVRFQPGLRVENTCGNCGAVQLRINGLEGQYSQVLLDSSPIFSSLAGVYGLEQLPVAMIERVEVIRGGGSALFGSNAIGGVVNIITKEPLRNSLSLSHTTGISKDSALENNTSINGSFVSDDHRAGVYIFGMAKDRDAIDFNDDGFTDVLKMESQTLGFRGYYKTSAYSKLTAEYHHIGEYRRGGDNIDLPPHMAEIAEDVRHKINGGSLRWSFFSPDARHNVDIYTSAQAITRNSYYGTGKDPNAYGLTKDLTWVSGAQYSYMFEKCLFMPAQFTVGAEYSYNDLNDHSIGFDRSILQTVRTAGMYLQNEWQSEKLNFVVGGRLDKHSMMEKVIFSPRANVRYSPIEDLGLRLSYSSGYRAPQAFDEDLHIDAVNNQSSIIELDPNLRPEYSHSLSASADLYHNFGRLQANLLVEGFYTILDDVFALAKTGENEAGYIIQTRYNAEGAKVKGLTGELKLGIPSIFEVQMGYTFQRSRYDEPEEWSESVEAERRMFRTPDHYGYFTATANPARNLKASVFGNFTGRMLVPHSAGYIDADRNEFTPSFWDMGIRIAYDVKLTQAISMEIFGGVKNILNSFQSDIDRGAFRDSVYIYGPMMPRSFFLGVNFKM
ncbi:MAG: TonB-dependent receptor [Alistipes sp.]|nr:TonB-dependent receptor [Alistipes sp.]